MEAFDHNVIQFGNAHARRQLWHFRYPHEVILDASLKLEDKRAILAAWASDIHAVESFPTLRHLPGTPSPVAYSAIMDARAQLDRLSGFDDDDPGPPPLAGAQKPQDYQFAA